jgi:hypothetical protein
MENLNIKRLAREPKLLPGSGAYASPSVRVDSVYEIETAPPLPGWPRGDNWKNLFNFKSELPDRLRAEHDGINKIIVSCDPGEHPNWLELVEAAIAKANKEEGTIPYAK